MVLATALAVGCGGGSTSPDDGNSNTNGAKVLTATINGTSFTATTVTSAYLGGNFTIVGNDGTRSLQIAAINLTGPGTYSLNFPNPYSALGMIVDGTGQFSTAGGGTGSFVLTTAVLGHVKGTFTFTAYTSAGTGLGKPVVTVTNGVFDLTNP
jgi:hypothetical protein